MKKERIYCKDCKYMIKKRDFLAKMQVGYGKWINDWSPVSIFLAAIPLAPFTFVWLFLYHPKVPYCNKIEEIGSTQGIKKEVIGAYYGIANMFNNCRYFRGKNEKRNK